MRLNTLSPAEGAKHAPKRVGRGIGSGLGKTGGTWSQRSEISFWRWRTSWFRRRYRCLYIVVCRNSASLHVKQ